MNRKLETLYLCGAGNSEGVRLALTINRREARWERIVILDDNPARHGQSILGVPIAGPLAALAGADRGSSEVANLVARTTDRRWSALSKIQGHGVPFATLIHPDVDVTGTEVGRDFIAYQHATLSPEVTIGESSVVFMGAVVGHESHVGRCCVVAAGAVLNARVELGDRVYVGSNATILPEIGIGEGATIGAGSAVVEDVPAGATAVGVPARILLAGRTGANAGGDRSSHDFRRDGSGAGVGSRGTTRGAVEADVELEQAIAGVWQDLLRLPAVDSLANFFDLGGTSLLAIQLQQRLQHTTGRDLPLTDIFQFPTIRSMARHIAAGAGGEDLHAFADGAVEDQAMDRADLRRQALLRRRRH